MPFLSQSGALFEDAEVELDLDCGDMTVTTQTGPGWSVEGEDRTPGGPEIRSDEGLLVVRSADGERGPLDFVGRHTTWRIALPTDPRLGLHAEVNAGSATFDLAGASLDVVDLETNAGSTIVDLSGARVVDEILIEMNAGSLGLTLPATSTHGSIDGQRRVGRAVRAGGRGRAAADQRQRPQLVRLRATRASSRTATRGRRPTSTRRPSASTWSPRAMPPRSR